MNDLTLPLWHGKPVGTRFNVWLNLRSRADWMLAFCGLLLLIGLSDLVTPVSRPELLPVIV